MASDAFLAALIAEPGTARPERDDPRRDPAAAPLDGRDADALLAGLRAIAPLIRHYGQDPETPDGHWGPYLPASTAAVEAAGGAAPPQHALLLAVLRLLARPQALLNGFTAEHLAWQMQRVLGFVPDAARPDRAHLVLQAKKGAAPTAVTPAQRFSAGKDATQVEQWFAPVRTTVIGAAQVERLVALHHDGGRLRLAPVANSADGLGAALPADAPRWPPFGRATLPPAPQGFAFASPLLRLAEGTRTVSLKLRVAGWPAGLGAAAFASRFDAWFTGPKGWLGPLALSGSLAGDVLTLRATLGPALEAVVDHDPALHRHAFPAALPVVQLLLKGEADDRPLAGITLVAAQLAVDVSGMRSLLLESDDATLDPKKAFLPFGTQPAVGSRLHVGCAEALGKPLTALTLHLTWQGAPPDLHDWYAGYARRGRLRSGVSASVTWQDANGTAHRSAPVTLLPRHAGPTTLTIDPAGTASASSPQQQVAALQWSGSASAWAAAAPMMASLPVAIGAIGTIGAVGFGPVIAGVFGAPAPAPSARAGFVTIALTEDLLHRDHAHDALAAITPPTLPADDFHPQVLNPPYTPKVQELRLDYRAESDSSAIGTPTQAAFTASAVQFFQVDALGVAREHAWLATRRPWAPQGGVTLLPRHAEAGEFLVALSGLAAGDEFSLLLQAAEGSADPQAQPQPLQWSVLADDAWRPLGSGELVLDSTNRLRTSGLVAGALPRETSTAHARCPAGWVWLRATVPASPRAVCDLVGVHANALEVVFTDRGNDPQRAAAPLPAGSITKARPPLAGVKAVQQPYAAFGGALAEDAAALARRAAERLRHRNRAVSAWDVERLVLQAFPQVWRAKCIPHARPGSWLAPGHVSVIVVPDLHNANAVDPLQPRVDLDTLTRIAAHLQARSAPQTQVHVRNPAYRALQLDFKLRLRPGHGFAYWAPQIDLALRRLLSPWAFDAESPLDFGTRVLRSALLAFVEQLPAVDFVTDFRLAREGVAEDLAEVVPEAPDEILVSAASHRIQELLDG